MITAIKVYSVFVLSSCVIQATPVVLQGSSASGDTVIAITSSDPEIEKYITFDFPTVTGAQVSDGVLRDITRNNMFDRSFTFFSPGKAAAGSGRSFASTTNFDPFSFPLFLMPLNYENFGLGNLGSWLKSIQGSYDTSVVSNGEIKTVTAVNNNGHVYGKVKTVAFDNQKGKRPQSKY